MNKKNTKQALLSSVIALLLCVSMLVSTTFAWFTDSVTSGNNNIIAGNLDVELYNGLDTNADKVDGMTTLFGDVELWEPGAVAYENLTVANVGTLALKYQLAVNFLNENATTDGYKLSQILKVGVVENGIPENTERADAVALVKEWKAMASFKADGELSAGEKDAPTTDVYGLVIYWEPSADDNNWNLNNDKKTTDGKDYLHIDLGINLVATQKMEESDSFGNDYDENATYIEPWDGKATAVPAADENGVITITTGGELAALAVSVNAGTTYSGNTVVLDADINLDNKAWTPIGLNGDKTGFAGIFDGTGHTIYNLNVDLTASPAYQAAGLFGSVRGAIKNLTVENAIVKNLTTGSATVNGTAVIVGCTGYGADIDNVHVINATVSANRMVGGIVGYASGSVTNCSVTNVTLTATPDDLSGSYDNGDKVGGIVGVVNYDTTVIDGNTVIEVVVVGYRDIGGVVGSAVGARAASVTNNKVSDSNIILDGSKKYSSSSKNAGAIIGRTDGAEVPANNTYTNVNIPDAGTMAYDEASGLYSNGKATWATYYIFNASDLKKAAAYFVDQEHTSEANMATIELMADIDLSGEAWTPWSVMWITLNGNDHTISNVTTDTGWRSGFFGYAGAATINDLTLENVTSVGAQAGTFAGSAEGLKVYNSYLKGTNSVTYKAYSSDSYTETWGGIGAVVGVLTSSTVNVEIVEGATVALTKGELVSDAPYVDNLTGYLHANGGTVVDNGEISVSVTASTADALAAALTGTDDHIQIVLSDDVDVPITSLGNQTPGSGQYKLGGEDTESITIDLNGKKLNITTTYWSAIGAKNADAVITVKNGSMTSSQATGTWNSYDLGFTDCKYVIENVVFDKAIYLDSDAELKNVTVNETHDYYAIWIPANGQTVEIDGLTVNSAGRGIKIDEEYVGSDLGKVSLKVSNATFTTAKKAAILVKSAAGADVALSNIDISGVAKDTVNAVWVDEASAAYYDLVTVTGGTKAQE